MTVPDPNLSIVVPIHNKAAVLERVVRAAANQNLASDRFEILLVDDHSTDGSDALVEHLAAALDPVRRVARKPGPAGASRSRNSGIEAARGDWVMVLDADVISHPDLVTDCLAWADAEDAVGLVPTCGSSTTQTLWPLVAPPPPGDVAHLTDGRWHGVADVRPPLDALAAPWVYFWTTAALVARDRLLALGGFDEELGGKGSEDIELGYRLFGAGSRFVLVDTAPVLHLPHPRNRTAEEATDRAHERRMLTTHRSLAMEMMCAFDAGHTEAALRRLAPLRPGIVHDGVWSGLAPHDWDFGRSVAFCAQSQAMIDWLRPSVVLDHASATNGGSREPFFGIALPYEDDAFDTALLPDLCGILPEALICRLFQEAHRVAKNVVYLRIDGARPGAALLTDGEFASFDRPYWERSVRVSRHFHDWCGEEIATITHSDGTGACTLVRVFETSAEG